MGVAFMFDNITSNQIHRCVINLGNYNITSRGKH